MLHFPNNWTLTGGGGYALPRFAHWVLLLGHPAPNGYGLMWKGTWFLNDLSRHNGGGGGEEHNYFY